MRVLVVDYHPSWAQDFERIKFGLIKTLGQVPYLSIEHVGSTSVPGLAAKPIIDVDIIVTPENLSAAAEALSSGGYTYNPEPTGIDRMSFRYDKHKHDSGAISPTEDGDVRRAIYLNVPTSVSLKNHLAVRKALLEDPELVKEYSDIKRELATREFAHIGSYGSAKYPILKKILTRSDLGVEVLKEIASVNKASEVGRDALGILASMKQKGPDIRSGKDHAEPTM